MMAEALSASVKGIELGSRSPAAAEGFNGFAAAVDHSAAVY